MGWGEIKWGLVSRNQGWRRDEMGAAITIHYFNWPLITLTVIIIDYLFTKKM